MPVVVVAGALSTAIGGTRVIGCWEEGNTEGEDEEGVRARLRGGILLEDVVASAAVQWGRRVAAGQSRRRFGE